MEEEINLADYFKVLSKRRKMVFFWFFIGLIIGGILTFTYPREYAIETFIDFDKIKDRPNLPQEIKNGDLGSYPGSMTILNLNELESMEIEIISEDLQGAKKSLENINRSILDYYKEKLKTDAEDENKRIRSDINLLKEEVEKTKNQIKLVESDIQRIKNRIETIRTENYEERIDFFYILEKLLERETVDLYSQISTREIEKQELNFRLKVLEPRIKLLNERLEEYQENFEEETKDISIFERPMSFNPALNIGFFGLAGLFMGVLLAFGREWWQKRYKDSS